MSDHEHRGSIWRETAAQLADHIELVLLELRFELDQAKRQALAGGVVLILALTGFILIQAGILMGLIRVGVPAWTASLGLGGIYLVLAVGIGWVYVRRDKKVGPPFQATQCELGKTLRWIQNLFS